MSHVNRKKGFTIIELTLAMGFVSALLLAIAMTVIQIGNIYNRGILYKNVNQSGELLAKEIKNGINSSESFSVSGADNHFIDETWGGRLCTGQYSYVWNYGKVLSPLTSPRNTYSAPTPASKLIRFIKVYDPGATYCSPNLFGVYPPVKVADAIELLDAGQHDLVIHGFKISSSPSTYDANTMQRLYSIEFSLGTNNQNALTTVSGMTVCKDPSESGSDPVYCSVSKFKIVARAGNSAE